MKLAQRTRSVAPFLAMEFSTHAAALEAQGHHIIRLNLGEPDFDAPRRDASNSAQLMNEQRA